MSLLFHALDKASREHNREQVFASVPLVKLRPDSFAWHARYRATMLFVLLMVAGAIGYVLPHEQKKVETPTVALPVHGTQHLGFAPPRTTSSEEKDSGGIHVAKEITDIPALDDENLRNIEMEIAHTKALSPHGKNGALVFANDVVSDDLTEPSFQDGLEKIATLQAKPSKESLNQLEQLAEKYPNVASLHAARAVVMSRLGCIKDSLPAWRMASSLEPQNQDYRLGLAVTLDKMDLRKDALAQYGLLAKPLDDQVRQRMDYLTRVIQDDRLKEQED